MNTLNTAQRILIVDDNPAIHEDFRKILAPEESPALANLDRLILSAFGGTNAAPTQERFELDFALQGADGVARAEAAKEEGRPFSIAFVDIRMPPGWDGVETITRLWEKDPRVQIVICTAYSDYAWNDILRHLGVSDRWLILKKPFDTAEVLQLAHALCCKWQLRAEVEVQMKGLDHLVRERTAEVHDANLTLRAEMAERTHAQEHYRLSEERLSAAFDASPLPIAILNASGMRAVRVNRALLEATGLDPIEAHGRDLWQLGIVQTPEFHADLARVHADGQPLSERACTFVTAIGTRREALAWVAPFAMPGGPHLLLMWQDVTHQRELEHQIVQTQKLDAVGQLAAGMAHDFNNLLTVIEGHSSRLSTLPGLPPTVVHSVEEIFGAAERAALLIRKMLAFAQKEILQKQQLDLAVVLNRLQPMLRSLLPEDVDLEIAAPVQMPAIAADASSLEQVILNLVINARDAMPDGGRLHIELSPVEITAEECADRTAAHSGRFVCLAVRDTGTGIEAPTLDRLFEPFFTTKKPGKGTGLGLAMVHGIVAQHDGWIEVDSIPDHGTCFAIYLPAGTGRADSERVAPVVEVANGHGETLLLVEDNAAVRELAVAVLTDAGYRVIQAVDGNEALNLWFAHRDEISLVFTDIVMPGGISGVELATQIRADRPEAKIIFSSGYAEIPNRKNFSESELFLAKPYRASLLTETVSRAFTGVSSYVASVA
jgi:PAS domain S-box-containing protein